MTSSEQQAPLLIPLERVARILGCNKASVAAMIKRGTLRASGEGTGRGVDVISLIDYLEARARNDQPGRAVRPLDLPGTTYLDRGKGRWYAQTKPDKYGNRVKSLGFDTEDEALAWLVQHEQDTQDKIKPDLRGKRLRDLLPLWRAAHDWWRPSTKRGYEQKERLYLIPTIGHIPLEDLKEEDWEHLVSWFQEENEEGEGYAPYTILGTYRCLMAALNWAAKKKYLRSNPLSSLDTPTAERLHKPVALDEKQARKFLKALLGHRLYALYLVAVRLGLRQGELLGLRRENLDLDKGLLHVVEQLSRDEEGEWVFAPPKTQKGHRTLHLSADLIEALREHLERIDAEQQKRATRWIDWGLVFPSEVGTPLSERNLVRHFKGLLESVGLPAEMHFHDLRHTAGSLMLNANIPLVVVSEILGHGDANVTAKVYGHAHESKVRDAVETMAELFARKEEE